MSMTTYEQFCMGRMIKNLHRAKVELKRALDRACPGQLSEKRIEDILGAIKTIETIEGGVAA